jgi:hypothetical protein
MEDIEFCSLCSAFVRKANLVRRFCKLQLCIHCANRVESLPSEPKEKDKASYHCDFCESVVDPELLYSYYHGSKESFHVCSRYCLEKMINKIYK